MSAAPVAVIGLGRMGGPMADCLIRAGHRVAVFDVAAEAMAPRVEAGARAAVSPADAARGAQVVCVVVFDDAQAAAVVDGPDGVAEALSPGAVVCIHTTVSLDTVERLAAGAPDGVWVVDAGISGGESGAQAGTLLTMVGGSDEAYLTAAPVLEAFSKEVLHAGPVGTGMALKLARNATSFAMMAVVHEALSLAHPAGVDLGMLKHTLTNTGLFEQALVPLGFGPPEPLPQDSPMRPMMAHAAQLGEKDLDQALALARTLRVDATLFARTREVIATVMRV